MINKAVVEDVMVREFIRANEHANVQQLVLKHKEIQGIPIVDIVNQIVGQRKALEKLPTYASNEKIIYPPGLNLEQSSSEQTAKFKSKFIEKRLGATVDAIADLTGGFGVDAFFLSNCAQRLDYVEVNADLLEIVRHNHKELRGNNIQHHLAEAEKFLDTSAGEYALIYIDPSRRVNAKKIVSLSDSEPDVIALQRKLFERAKYVLIKASPMLDIAKAVSELGHVERVLVVAVHNEVKELLFFLNSDHHTDAVVEAVNLMDGSEERFEFRVRNESALTVSLSEPKQYLYEPNAAIMKAGAFKSVADRYLIPKLHVSTHLYTSDLLLENFPGRIFKVESFVKPDKKTALLLPDKKANVMVRNYPLTPDEVKRKIGIGDGGDHYIIGFSGPNKKHLALATRVK